jgi:catalase
MVALGDGVDLLTSSGVDTSAPGVLTCDGVRDCVQPLRDALGMHRSWERLAIFAG